MSLALGSEPPGPIAWMARVAARLGALRGTSLAAASFAAGGLATLALPPAHLVPALWIAFPLLLCLLAAPEDHARPLRRSFWVGWWFGFGHHVIGLYWISVALFVDLARFWWAVPLAVAGLPALLGVFTGLATLATALARRRFQLEGVPLALAFAVAWTVAEWLRGHLFTGFPWNLIGYGWTFLPPVLQAVSVVGIYGLSLVTVIAAALPIALAGGRPDWRPAGVGLAMIAAIAVWGAVRMAGTEGRVEPGTVLRIVQPNIPQGLKWAPEVRIANLRRHLELSIGPGHDRVTDIVWPETAVPFFPERNPEILPALGRVVPAGGQLLTGIPRLSETPDGRLSLTNSLIAVNADGEITASFDKFHLVPFGEYLPFRRWLPQGLSAVASVGIDTAPGPGPRTLAPGRVPPFSPLICYEAIFPGASVASSAAGERPRWLLNVTNDAWYGRTAGPHQHFAIALTRAVEQGLPMVRAANTGVSGVIDAYGRVTGRLGLGEEGVLDAPLPAAAEVTPLYARYGDILLGISLLSVVGALGFFIRRL